MKWNKFWFSFLNFVLVVHTAVQINMPVAVVVVVVVSEQFLNGTSAQSRQFIAMLLKAEEKEEICSKCI